MKISYFLLLVVLEISARAYGSLTQDDIIALPEKVNYKTAVDLCKSKGMKLIKIQDEDTNKVVHDFATRNKLGVYWIDGDDIVNEGQWKHDDGTKLTYSKWQSGEPNNYGNEDCLQGNRYPNGFWNDIKCESTSSVICYKDKLTGSISEDELIPIPYTAKYKSTYYICKLYGASLIKIQDDDTNKLVHDFANKKNLGKFWIDGSDSENEGQWKYSDGTELTYSKWENGEPNGQTNENCIQGNRYPNGFWNDVKCDDKMSVICYKKKPDSEYDKYFVVLPDKANYQTAVSLCKSNGTKLIKIKDDSMNQAVYNYANKNQLGRYWIDANDIGNEGQWKYNDGRDAPYKNWQAGEPNNYKNNEHCAIGNYYPNGFWNDISCEEIYSVICIKGKLRSWMDKIGIGK